MPNFNTVQQAQTWCTQHFPAVQPHWSFPDMTWVTVGFWAAIVGAIYMAGRIGLPQLWTDVKTMYSSVRGLSAKVKKTTATTTPVTPATS